MFWARCVLNLSAVVILWVCNIRHVLLFWLHVPAPPSRAACARLCFYNLHRFTLLNNPAQQPRTPGCFCNVTSYSNTFIVLFQTKSAEFVCVNKCGGFNDPSLVKWALRAISEQPSLVRSLTVLERNLNRSSYNSPLAAPLTCTRAPLCPQITSTALPNLQRSRPRRPLLLMWVRSCCQEPGPARRARGSATSQSATWSSAPAWSRLRRRKRRVRSSTATGWPSRQVLSNERQNIRFPWHRFLSHILHLLSTNSEVSSATAARPTTTLSSLEPVTAAQRQRDLHAVPGPRSNRGTGMSPWFQRLGERVWCWVASRLSVLSFFCLCSPATGLCPCFYLYSSLLSSTIFFSWPLAFSVSLCDAVPSPPSFLHSSICLYSMFALICQIFLPSHFFLFSKRRLCITGNNVTTWYFTTKVNWKNLRRLSRKTSSMTLLDSLIIKHSFFIWNNPDITYSLIVLKTL